MIITLKSNQNTPKRESLISWLKSQGMRVEISEGEHQTILGLIGDTSKIDTDLICSVDIVESVSRVSEPFKKASRKFHPDNTVVKVGSTRIGNGHFAVMAGPCSVENEAQVLTIARAVKAAGASLFRGGAYKPRTSPYAFQGLGKEGIDLLIKAKKETGMPIVTEIMDAAHLRFFDDVDMLQIGARNMQNFELLKQVAKVNKPVLLKRGMNSSIEEWLMSAEYLMSEGNPNVVLCERGIRTTDSKYTRNTLDLSAIPVVGKLSHLPIIVDPSHATGRRDLVESMSLGAIAVGSNGLQIEVHNQPEKALCDGAQSLAPEQFASLMTKARTFIQATGRELN